MRVLVFEPDPAGHHFAYLSLMLPAVAALASETLLLTGSDAPATDAYRLLIRPLEDRIKVEASVPPPAASPRQIARDRAAFVLAAARRHRPDHLMVMYADGMAQALAVRRLTGRSLFPRGMSTEALFLRGAFAYPASGMKRRLYTLVGRALARRAPFTYLHHLDPLAYDHLRSARWSLMPDPVERPPAMSATDARRRLGISTEGRILGCAGAIDTRKGIDLLLAAFARADLPDRLLLLGPQDAAVRALLAGTYAPLARDGRIIAMDRFFAPADLAAGLCAMDLVCTPYPDHVGSASIVIRAAAANRPVLGSTFGWVGRTVAMFGLGRTCEVTDTAAFADNIRSGLDEAPAWRPTLAVERFVRFHSPENFAKAWCVGLRRRLGLPPEPGALTWEWVLEALQEQGGRSARS